MQRTEQLPCFLTILVRLGLAQKSLGVPAAYELFLRISTDEVVKAKKGKGFPSKVTAPYMETALKLNSLTPDEINGLKQRMAEFRFR